MVCGPRISQTCQKKSRSEAAARQLWAFLGAHDRSRFDHVEWVGSPDDPMFGALDWPSLAASSVQRWILRLLDVPGALEARGYPGGVRAELHLDVRDDFLPGNQGHHVLSVSGGRGKVARGGRGELKLDVGALAPLYTGYHSVAEWSKFGRLEAGHYLAGGEDELQYLSRVGYNGEPAMPQFVRFFNQQIAAGRVRRHGPPSVEPR